jgi:hypothetical protein
MAKAIIRICDVCKSEQRENSGAHWTEGFCGPASLDFKNLPNVQSKIDWDVLCPPCGGEIAKAVYAVIKKRSPKEEDKIDV